MLGALLTAAFIVFGGESVRQNPGSIALGGVVLVIAFTAIGWLAGRARVFKRDEYSSLENAVNAGETLVSVVCETADGVDQARAILERSGAVGVRSEESGEGALDRRPAHPHRLRLLKHGEVAQWIAVDEQQVRS
jgi:hypothetical protein